MDLVRRGQALLRGSVCAGSSEVPGVPRLFYATIPVFLRDGFRTWQGSDPPTVFVWLVPITSAEHQYIERRG